MKKKSKSDIEKIVNKKKKKRIIFPWIRLDDARKYKALIAAITDHMVNVPALFKKGYTCKQIFLREIYPKLRLLMPEMRVKVRSYYKKHGRAISNKEFKNLVYMRWTCMYKMSAALGQIEPSKEHPRKTKTGKAAMQSAYAKASLMLEDLE